MSAERSMTEFDKLRALLDMPRPADPANFARADTRTLRRGRWARLLWSIFVVVTLLDAIYLLAQALRSAGVL
jgi:hypothetical protein